MHHNTKSNIIQVADIVSTFMSSAIFRTLWYRHATIIVYSTTVLTTWHWTMTTH